MSLQVVTSVSGFVIVDLGTSYKTRKESAVTLRLTSLPQHSKDRPKEIQLKIEGDRDTAGQPIIVNYDELRDAMYACQKAYKDEDCF